MGKFRLVKRPDDSKVPATFGQQGLWLLSQMEPSDTTYNISIVLRIGGRLSVPALRQTLKALLHRNEIFRTTFRLEDGIPFQTIEEERAEPFLLEVDLSNVLGDDCKEIANRHIYNAARERIDLEKGPLIRFLLIRLGAEETLLSIVVHHIVADGWSLEIASREIGILYGIHSGSGSNGIPNPLFQYGDYALWQRKSMNASVLSQGWKYWREVLDGATTEIEMFSDRPRPRKASHVGGRLHFHVSVALTKDLKELARRSKVTLFIELLAGFFIFLYTRYGRKDIVVGIPVSGRDLPETENIIGMFANLIAIRVRLSESMSFRDVLSSVKRTVVEAYKHQDYPVSELVEKYWIDRHLDRVSLLPILFGLQNFPEANWHLPGVAVTREQPSIGNVRCDLDCRLRESLNGIEGTFDYSAEMFDEGTIEALSKQYLSVLETVVQSPDQSIRSGRKIESDVLDAVEGWNRTAKHYPKDQTIHGLFAEQVQRSPDAIALECQGHQLTYRELDLKSELLARHCRSVGIGPGAVVGVAVGRSMNLVEALIAVLKTGAAFVPLDTDYPKQRLKAMILDSGITSLLTEKAHEESFSEFEAQIVLVDRFPKKDASVSAASYEEASWGGSLAYVLYTSGSTGIPKGVMICHNNAVNLFFGMDSWIEDHHSSRTWLAVTSISFDISILELFWTLTRGYRTVLHTGDLTTWIPSSVNSDSVASLILRKHVSHLQCTPSTIRMLTDTTEGRAALRHLRKLLIGGEVFAVQLAEQLIRETASDILNMYGPTETTVWSAVWRVNNPSMTVPIGRPIANTQMYILDGELEPVPVGHSGELFIAGDGVGWGYLHQPGATANAFIPNPFSSIGGMRMYRTGDVARHRPDGNIEFLGRYDNQVKIRGRRIELEEIESVIRNHPLVSEAATVAVNNGSRDKTIVTFVVPYLTQSDEEHQAEAERHRLDEWRVVWDETYLKSPNVSAGADFVGWNNRRGSPIAVSEMYEWVDGTVARINSLNPLRVLEIGCGTGLLLHRIAPRCQYYAATDPSGPVIDKIKRQLSETEMKQVDLRIASAHELEYEPDSFDLVILNSVVQYFPSTDYLLSILKRAIGWIQTGGNIFLGDIRNLRLLEALCTNVEVDRATKDIPIAELRRRITNGIENERELAIAPEFFKELKGILPRVGWIESQLKIGKHVNELNSFRYDVVLHLDDQRKIWKGDTLKWHESHPTMMDISRKVLSNPSGVFRVLGVPNARLSTVRDIMNSLRDSEVGTVAHLPDSKNYNDDIFPEALWKLGIAAGAGTTIDWSDEDPFSMDVLFVGPNASPVPDESGTEPEARGVSHNPKSMANDPLRTFKARELERRLRKHIGEVLPEYMMSPVVVTGSLPLGPTGKVNRRMLADLYCAQHETRREIEIAIAPRTSTEQILLGIWREVFNLEDVGIEDDFFELGGHSLLAVRILNQIHEHFKCELTLRQVMERTTIARMSLLLDHFQAEGNQVCEQIQVISRDGLLPLSFQQYNVFNAELMGQKQHQVRLGLLIEGDLDAVLLESALNQIVSRHEILRTTFLPVLRAGPVEIEGWDRVKASVKGQNSITLNNVRFLPTIHTNLSIRLRNVTLEAIAQDQMEETISRFGKELAESPFDYSSAPMIRSVLLKVSSMSYRLLIGMPHLLCDGWSMQVFANELLSHYWDERGGSSSSLPSLAIQYIDYAHWQNQRHVKAHKTTKSELQKDDCPPLDMSDPSLGLYVSPPVFGRVHKKAGHQTLALDKVFCSQLGKMGHHAQVTISMLLLAAYGLYLHLISEKRRIRITTVQSNRNHPQLENLIGFFASGQWLCLDVSFDPTFVQLCEQVRNEMSESTARGDEPRHDLESHTRSRITSVHREKSFGYEHSTRFTVNQTGDLLVRRYRVFLDERVDFAFKLQVDDKGEEGIDLTSEYCVDCFEPQTVSRMLTEYERLLKVLLKYPRKRVSELKTKPLSK